MVYHKTAAGAAEIQNRQHGLRAELRRLLIMVDGKSPLTKFAPAFPGADIHALALELAALGLIADDQAASSAASAPAVTNRPVSEPAHAAAYPQPGAEASGMPAQPTVEQFLAARQAAVRFVNDNLGPSGESIALEIERCSHPDELRAKVRETKATLERFLGSSTGQRFLEYVRGAVDSAS